MTTRKKCYLDFFYIICEYLYTDTRVWNFGDVKLMHAISKHKRFRRKPFIRTKTHSANFRVFCFQGGIFVFWVTFARERA